MKDKELAELIENWFKSKQNNPNKFNNFAVGRVIRRYVEMSGNWKVAARGNPRKGFNKMKEILAGRLT